MSFLERMIRSNGFYLLIMTIVIALCVTIFISPNFLTDGNIRGGIFVPMVVSGIMIVAVGPLLIGGGIDLSCAAQAALASVVFAKLLEMFPMMPWPVILLVVLLCGVVFGLVNTFLCNGLNIMPFVATIGTMSIYRGLGQAWTLNNNVPVNNDGFTTIGGTIPEVLGVDMGFMNAVPLLFLVMILLIAVYTYVLSNTRFGRSVYMCGGNPTAARLAGLNPKRVRAALYINSGVISAFAGVVWAAQYRMGHATSLADNMPNFSALTAVILGGVSFIGGSGGLVSGFIALLLVTVFDNGMSILAIASAVGGRPAYGAYVNTTLVGLILVIALMIDYISSVRKQRALVSAAMKRHAERKAAKAAEGS